MDSILFWSAVVIECNRLDHSPASADTRDLNRGPTRSSRATAMAHIAMHDAYFAVAGFGGISGGSPKRLYLDSAPPYAGGATDADIASAVSGAASTVLLGLYPPYRAMIDSAWLAHL